MSLVDQLFMGAALSLSGRAMPLAQAGQVYRFLFWRSQLSRLN